VGWAEGNVQGADDAASQPDAMEGLVSAFVCVAAGTTFQHWPFTL